MISKHPQPIVGKWQFVYSSGPPVQFHSDLFTHYVTCGIFKLKSLPPEGSRLKNADYTGFIVSWYYWWPLRRGGKL